MFDELDQRPEPDWLQQSDGSLPPMRSLLANSVFYPSPRFNWKPIAAYAGHCHSFVYVDYQVSEESVRSELERFPTAVMQDIGHMADWNFLSEIKLDQNNFFRAKLSYKPSSIQTVTTRDLLYSNEEWSDDELVLDERCEKSLRHQTEPEAIWSVFDIKLSEDRDRRNRLPKAKRFSLLYIFGTGAAIFQALYYRYKCHPLALVLDNPDPKFAEVDQPRQNRWMMTTDEFLKVVFDNPNGSPRLLFVGDTFQRDSGKIIQNLLMSKSGLSFGPVRDRDAKFCGTLYSDDPKLISAYWLKIEAERHLQEHARRARASSKKDMQSSGRNPN